MRVLEFDTVFNVNGRLAIKLTTFAKLLNYSDIYLLQLIKKLLKKGIKLAFKWKKSWYIFLPSVPIKSIIQAKNSSNNGSGGSEPAIIPSGISINTDWAAAIDALPPAVNTVLEKINFTISVVNGKLVVLVPSTKQLSSTVDPKKVVSFFPSNLGLFPAITDYKYGYYIFYNPDKMSTFDPGVGGTLKSTQIPSAFFEVCRALDAAENARNGANPGLPARRNLSTTASFDTGTIAVAATIPVVVSIQTGGVINVEVSDYLGATYSTFNGGGGDLSSTNIVAAFLEVATLLSAAEKSVTPIEDQPNNIQIQFDAEAGSATVAANIPFTTSGATTGDVTIKAIDYL